MKTEQLLASLVADGAHASPLRRRVAWAVAAGCAVSLVIFAVEFGLRVDLSAAFATWRFDLKLALVLAAVVAAFAACIELARPLASRSWCWRVIPALVMAAGALVVELLALPREAWGARLVGSNALICLTAIPLLAFAPLAALLHMLRRAAPASPARAGAAAGALAATCAATIYAFHCFDDSPLFVLTWYPLAAIPVIVVGALVGHRLLRW